MTKANKLISLQYLRGIAAILVVLSHAQQMIPALPVIVPYFFGNFGVYVFFALSGFLMVYVSDLKSQHASTFWISRFLRVAPIYWLITLGVFALLFLAPKLGVGTEISLQHLALSLLFIPHTTTVDPETFLPMLRVGWTLIYEMYFYTIFAVSMTISFRYRVFLTTAFMLIPLALQLELQSQIDGSMFLYVFGDLIVLQFVFGMVLARITLSDWTQDLICRVGFSKHPLHRLKFWLLLALLASSAIFIMGVFDRHEILQNPELRVIAYGFPSILLLVTGLLYDHSRPSALRIPLTLGEASYSIYLIHMLPLALIRFLIENFLVLPETMTASLLFIAISSGLSVAVGLITYWWIELPLLSIKKWYDRCYLTKK